MKHFNFLKRALLPILLVLAAVLPASAQTLSGTYTVGTGGNYATLSAAIADLNSKSIVGPVVMNILPGTWSGTAWQGQLNSLVGASATNTVTFQAQNGPGSVNITVSGGVSNNYIFRLNNTNWVTVKDLTLNNNNSIYGVDVEFMGTASNNTVMNCTLTGDAGISTSTSKSRIYANGVTGSNNNVSNNTFPQGCSWAVYLFGSFSTRPTNWEFNNNTMNPYYGTIYAYYMNDLKFRNNNITKFSTSGYQGMYFNYCDSAMEITGNTQICNGMTSTYYGIYRYYCFGKTTQPQLIANNTFTSSTTTTSYIRYNYFSARDSFVNNTFTHTNTTGTNYFYHYYNDYSSFVNNTVTINTTSGIVYLYNMYGYASTSAQLRNLFLNNTINVTASSSGSIYNYLGYYGINNKYNNNTVNLTSATGTVVQYNYYGTNYEIIGNTFNVVSNGSGTVYGLYDYSTNTYPNGTVANNKIFAKSGTGLVYGMQQYYHVGTMNIYNNSITAMTGGFTSYAFYCYYMYEPGVYNIYNNTIHNASTSTSNHYGLYLYTALANGRADLKNNIVSRATSAGVPLIYTYSPLYAPTDYNNFFTPGTNLIQSGTSPSGTYGTISAWRAASNQDKNSLSYLPAYTSATTGNLTPDGTNPNCWSMNGRGVHIPGNNGDINGNSRHIVTSTGVPDLGAYEFTPTAGVLPPDCAVTPATPAAGITQTYTFGGDTVATVTWDALATVPGTSPTVKQYTGTVPPGLSAINPTNMYFYTDINSGTSADYTANIYYKDPWMGTIASEAALRLAKKDGINPWIGYPATTSGSNTIRNFIYSPAAPMLNTYGLYTGIDVANNASAAALVEPAGTFCPGTFVVKALIKNTGNNNINSLKIDWTLDGIPQPQINWTTMIPYNNGTPGSNEVTVTLGSVTFGTAPRTIKVWTSLPNNVVDPIAADDTLGPVQKRAALAGEYTVGGITPDFVNMVTAISDLKAAGMCGPVTFRVRAGTYVGNLDIVNIPGSSAANRITIRADNGVPASAVNINYGATGTGDNYVIRLNNTSFVTIKDVTVNATGTGFYAICIRLAGTTANDSIVGCNLNASTSTLTTSICGVEGYQSNYPNLTVLNNNITASCGMYMYSNTSNTPGLLIEGNNINGTYAGIMYVYNFAGAKVRNNNITGIGTTNYYGLYYWDVTGNTMPIEMVGNKIKDFWYGCYYLYFLNGSPTNRSQVNNNIVSYNGTGTAYAGILSYYPQYTNFFNNTCVLGGTSYTSGYAAFIYQATYQSDSVYNNVFSNHADGYAYYGYMPTGYNHRMDFNNLYTTGSTLAYDAAYGSYANMTLLRNSPGATGNGNAHANSISYHPGINMSTGVPDNTNPNVWSINGRGLQMPSMAKDIVGNNRPTTRATGVPDLGAYEVEPSVIPPAATPSVSIPAPGVTQVFDFGRTTVATVKWNTQLALTSPINVRQYSGSVPPANFPVFSQNKYPYFYTDIKPTGLGSSYDFDLTLNYYDTWLGTIGAENNLKLAHKFNSTPWVSYNAANSSANVTTNTIFAAGVTSFGEFTGVEDGIIFSANVKVVGSIVLCTGNSVTLNASPVSSGSTTYTYQWRRNGVDIAGAVTPSYVVTSGGDYTVVITATSVVPNKTAESIPISVTVVAPPMALITANGALTYCQGSSLQLNAGSVPNVSYQWKLNGVDIPGATANTYNVTGAGSYSVVTKNIGCSSTSTNTLVNAGPILVELGADITGCEIKNVPYVLDAGYPGAKYLWSTGDTTQTINVFKGTGIYSVTVDAGPNCIGNDQVTVALNPLPTAAGISYLRSGNTYTFSPSGVQNATTYLWTFSDGSTSAYKNVTKIIEGTMTVNLIIGNDCGKDTITMVNWATGINNTVNEGLIADLYPNPANEKVTLSIKGATMKDVTIINALGEVVYRAEMANTTEHSVNVSALASGRYIIRATTTDGILSKPLNVQR